MCMSHLCSHVTNAPHSQKIACVRVFDCSSLIKFASEWSCIHRGIITPAPCPQTCLCAHQHTNVSLFLSHSHSFLSPSLPSTCPPSFHASLPLSRPPLSPFPSLPSSSPSDNPISLLFRILSTEWFHCLKQRRHLSLPRESKPSHCMLV